VRSHAKASTQRQTLWLALLIAAFCLVFGAGSASAVAPTISSTGVTGVTTKTAILEAGINPGGEATTYHFEYGLADCSASSCTSAPVPDGNVGSGSSAVQVKKEIKGLTPGATYHFRAVASNGSGPITGPDHTFKTYAPSPDSSSCPNQALRVGFSAALPDCRAYEMVSPVDKGGADIVTKGNFTEFRTALNQASVTGNKFTYSSYKAFGDSAGSLYSNQYIASRGTDGWTTHGITPAHEGSIFVEYDPSYDLEVSFRAFTEDLSSAWLTDDADPPLTSDAVEGRVNIFRRDNTSNTYQALTTVEPAPGSTSGSPGLVYTDLQGHSRDGSHAVFAISGALTPDADPNEVRQLYDFSGGDLHLVSLLPDGTASPQDAYVGNASGVFVGERGRDGALDHAVSDDGSRIFWNSNGEVYVRIDDQMTVPVSESVASKKGARFQTASRDGSSALFTANASSETGGARVEDLYAFDVDTESTTLIAHKVYNVFGASEDASYVYFLSAEDLDSGATAGEPNLYLDHEGDVTFIANLNGEASLDSNQASGYTNAVSVAIQRPSRVTPDGHSLAFQSTRSLTGYDNTDAIQGEPDLEVFHYDADTKNLTCVSCNPSGARPVGQPLRQAFHVGDIPVRISNGNGQRGTAAWLTTAENSLYTPRTLSEDGNRLFFNSFDALVPQDTNSAQDVYEWEAQGSGSCDKTGGCISLISTGQSSEISEFVDASPDGRDVFFSTSSSIDPRDPGLIDIYDARAGGGYPPPPAPPTPCVGDACQSVPQPPNDATPASANFHGAGDPAQRKSRRRCAARKRHGAKQPKARHKKKAKECRRANRRAK